MDIIVDDLMEQLYFVTSYDELKQGLDWDDEFEKALRHLIQQGWVNQLRYDKASGDFVKLDNLAEELKSYSYLATKKGLLAHNGM